MSAPPFSAAQAQEINEEDALASILMAMAVTPDANPPVATSDPAFSFSLAGNASSTPTSPAASFTSSAFKSRKSGGAKSKTAHKVGNTSTNAASSDEVSPIPIYITANQFGKRGNGEDEFQKPMNVALSNGLLYTTDGFAHRIQIWDISSGDSSSGSGSDGVSVSGGKFVKSVGKQGKGPGELDDPKGITVSGGLIYVADYGNHRVLVFRENAEIEFVRQFGKFGSGEGEFNGCISVAVEDNRLYVCDQRHRRVQIFNTEPPYQFMGQFGEKGKKPGQFDHINSIAVSKGLAYVCDTILNRISVFDTKSLTFVRILGTEFVGRIYTPGCITIVSGRIYVSDVFGDCVHIFDEAKGTVITKVGSSKDLLTPGGVAVTNDGKRIFVADVNNARIQQFQLTQDA